MAHPLTVDRLHDPERIDPPGMGVSACCGLNAGIGPHESGWVFLCEVAGGGRPCHPPALKLPGSGVQLSGLPPELLHGRAPQGARGPGISRFRVAGLGSSRE